MKVAVIGGGTAGYLAAVHLTKEFPRFDLYHIYDPNIPTIGVGEGTTPDFVGWLHKTTDVSFSTLQEQCQTTKKFGIGFENWGQTNRRFTHNFYPAGENYAYHISAKQLVTLLDDHVNATHIPKKVVDLHSRWQSANILFEDETQLEVDFVFDARGFPRQLDDEQHNDFSIIPTNSAMIRTGPPTPVRVTRSVARPHGWIFIIPLLNRTSYGYVYNRNINSESDIEADFDQFLKEDGVKLAPDYRELRLKFPNFSQKTYFDGSVFKIGNAAAFMEPLEATSIHFILIQIKVAARWPLSFWHMSGQKKEQEKEHIHKVNNFLDGYGRKMALFIGWHYSEGAHFDTPFWQYAQANFQRELAALGKGKLTEEFHQYRQALSILPNPITEADRFEQGVKEMYAAAADKERLTAVLERFPRVTSARFAMFPDLSFAEIGHGIGSSIPVPA